MADPPPALEGILETALYCGSDERDAVRSFYADVLALREVAGWDDGTAYRLGAGVLLLFDRDLLARRQGPIADHGAAGPGHACFVAEAGAYERWRSRLEELGVEIAHEHEWGGTRRSFYFRDPAGNLLEIADGDLWPR